jgi:hypothetical protein
MSIRDKAVAWSIDDHLKSFISVSEVADGEFFAGPLFRRKFGDGLPTIGHHIVAFYRSSEGAFAAASYLHIWMQGAIGLIGGGCTDGGVLRTMSGQELGLVNASGGLLKQTLGFCFARFESQLDAYFGHCGEPRAKEVDLSAGFVETELPNLLVRYNRPLTPARQRQLLEQVQRIGAF